MFKSGPLDSWNKTTHDRPGNLKGKKCLIGTRLLPHYTSIPNFYRIHGLLAPALASTTAIFKNFSFLVSDFNCEEILKKEVLSIVKGIPRWLLQGWSLRSWFLSAQNLGLQSSELGSYCHHVAVLLSSSFSPIETSSRSFTHFQQRTPGAKPLCVLSTSTISSHDPQYTWSPT